MPGVTSAERLADLTLLQTLRRGAVNSENAAFKAGPARSVARVSGSMVLLGQASKAQGTIRLPAFSYGAQWQVSMAGPPSAARGYHHTVPSRSNERSFTGYRLKS